MAIYSDEDPGEKCGFISSAIERINLKGFTEAVIINFELLNLNLADIPAACPQMSRYTGFDLNFLFHWPAGPVILAH